jgi:hypothetical protein
MRPISQWSLTQKVSAITTKLEVHAARLRKHIAKETPLAKRNITVARRCIRQLANELEVTLARAVVDDVHQAGSRR